MSEEATEARSVEELINDHIAYSDMTDEEIALVVEYKAQIKARDAEHEARMQALSDNLNAIAAKHDAMADTAQASYDALIKSLGLEG